MSSFRYLRWFALYYRCHRTGGQSRFRSAVEAFRAVTAPLPF